MLWGAVLGSPGAGDRVWCIVAALLLIEGGLVRPPRYL